MKNVSDLEAAVATFDRPSFANWRTLAEQERTLVLEAFPIEQWPQLPLERYALGLEESGVSFCNLIERRTPHVGSIRGGSSHKLLIFKYRQKPGWYFPDSYQDENEAWEAVRAGFVEMFSHVANKDFAKADQVAALAGAPAMRVKTAFIYYPDGLLPICSRGDLNHFLSLLGLEPVEDHGSLSANCRLYEHLEGLNLFEGWSPYEIERFLYTWAHPRRGSKIIKIAPGENAKLWDQCRTDSVIRVGWDDVGDLTSYATKDEFKSAFATAFPGPQQHISRKANELWTLRDLEPGDTIVANKGTATVVGIGRVTEPGYQYREDLPEYKHTVAVDWYDTQTRQIEPIRKWAFATVSPIQQAVFRRIVGDAATDVQTGIAPTVDPLFIQLEETLERKSQVILFGPPGTGKTYAARRFAVSWLWRQGGGDADQLLSDSDAFHEAEQILTEAGHRKAWWFVASPAHWKWQQLLDDGSVHYSRGKIAANFDELQIGDLVFGYEANPTKRIVVLARVTDWWIDDEASEDGVLGPILTPLLPVKDGPTWQEVKEDQLLSESQAVHNQAQGTLFAVSDSEAERLLEMIEERDSFAASAGWEALSLPAGHLTSVTFHPSYTYEDFVEGFKPQSMPGVPGLNLALSDGIFKKICDAANSDPDSSYVLLIDEINRGNLPKIFGELVTVLEKDKRDVEVLLSQSGTPFAVPSNLYIVGTMNTADRSIRTLDAALRRRFAFMEMLPRSDILEGAVVGPLALDEFLEELNSRIRSKYGRDKQIGHSYFLDNGAPIAEPETFARVLRDEVVPLLQEYSYDHYGDLQDLLGAGVVDASSETLQADVIADAEAFVAALYEEFQQPPTDAE